MTEKEHNVEILRTSFLLEELLQQREKLCSGEVQEGTDILHSASLAELDEAIVTYDEEKYSLPADREVDVELLCTGYSLERLILQRGKVRAGTAQGRQMISEVIDTASLAELDEAIDAYDEEKYSIVRQNQREALRKLWEVRKNSLI